MRARDARELPFYPRWVRKDLLFYAVRQRCLSASSCGITKRETNDGKIAYLVNGSRGDMSEG